MYMNAHDIADRIEAVEAVNDNALRFNMTDELYISGVLDAAWGANEYTMYYSSPSDADVMLAVYEPQG